MLDIDTLAARIQSERLTLPEALERYEDHDHWAVRRAFAQAQRQQALESGVVPVQNLTRQAQMVLDSEWFRPIKITLPAPKRVRPKFQTAGRVTGIISDLHAGTEHDPHALDVMIQIGQAVGWQRLIINGDLFDCGSLSRYTPKADQPLRWRDERALAAPVAALLRYSFPDIPIDFRLGNHDIRPLSYIDSNAPALAGIYDTATLLGIQDLEFTLLDEEFTTLAEGQLLVKHGTSVSSHSAYTVKKEVERAGMSVIMGHVHRIGVHEVTKTSQVLRGEMPWVGIEAGCLCRLNPPYLPPEDTANWQQGFVIVHEFGDGIWNYELVKIHAGRAFYRGQMFSSRL